MASKYLYRSIKDRKIAGVAGGIAEYLNIDSTVIRLIWILAILFGGAGFLAYLIAWILIPEEKEGFEQTGPEERGNPRVEKSEFYGGTGFWGILLIALGGILLLREFIPYELTRYFWPIIIIGLGLFLLIHRK